MAEFTAVVQQLAKNNEEERQRDSNMNQNIAYQSEQTRGAIQSMVQSITDGLANTTNSLVDSAEATTSAITAPKPDGGKDEEQQNRMMRLFQNIKGGIGSLVDSVKDKAKAAKEKGFGFLKNLLIGGAIIAALAFLNSPYWEKTKVLIKEKVIPAIRYLYDNYITPFFDSITGIGESFTKFWEDPSWENFTKLFGDAGTIILGLGAVALLFAPLKTFAALKAVARGFIGLFTKGGAVTDGLEKQTKRMKGRRIFGGLRRGLTSLMGAFSGLGTSLMDMATGTKKDAKGQLRTTGKKGLTGAGGPAGRFASGATRGVGAVAKGAAKLIPGVGLIATAAFGIFDAVSAGLNEAKKETATAGSIAKESVAGLLSGLTFGLVTQEKISNGITKIGEGISGGITAVKDGVMSVVNDPVGTFNSMTTKINELTGLSLPDFATSKESIIAFGQSMKDKAADLAGKFEEFTGINIPTFSEAKDSISKIGTDLMGKFDGIMDSVNLDGAKSALSGIGDSLTDTFSSFKDGVMGLFSDDRSDEQKLQDRISELTKDTSKQNFFESDAQHKAELDELAKLREEYAALISGGGGGGTTIINNNAAPAGAGAGGGGTTAIVPEPMSNNAHPRNSRMNRRGH
tara:strand:+ start:235 stop:2118 length:1884 start_codon:yes stop_codon:yes gene_type:complete